MKALITIIKFIFSMVVFVIYSILSLYVFEKYNQSLGFTLVIISIFYLIYVLSKIINIIDNENK